jgi:hypothetical protein
MVSRPSAHRLLELILAAAVLSHPARGDDEIESLIDGLISRATAVHTVKLAYDYSSRVQQGGRQLHQQQTQITMAIEGASWIVRHDSSTNFRMQRNEISVSYYELPSEKTNEVFRSLHLEAPVSLQDLIAEHACYAAPRLGSVWFPQQVTFIDRHRAQAVLRGRPQIQGIETVELEWPVTATDFDEALIVIPNPIARDRRGRLRICIAPSLGHALPRIQYVTDDGHSAQVFAASTFEQFGQQLFFPRHVECSTELDNGQDTSTFEIRQVSNVNQSFAPDEFLLQIPQGTRVRDSRPGVPTSIFYLNEQNQIDDLNRALDPGAHPPRPGKRMWLLVVNSAFLITCLGAYVIKRCYHQPSSR